VVREHEVKQINIPQKQASVNAVFLADNAHSPEFLKSISHELRTPLNVIIGICQFLERDQKTPLSPMHRDAVDRMDRNARALLQSVKRLMEELRNGKAH
jgi:signal transduction histidine kinase